MRGNFERAFREILKHEGGFVNHPKDPGGITNLGVTRATYEAWVGHRVPEQVMRELTPDHVRALYKARYWDAVKANDMPDGVDLCLFDFGVNAGPARARKYLQLVVGAKADGIIGPNTMKQVQQYLQAHGAEGLIDAYQSARERYYRKLRHFPTFGRGWLRRVKEVRVAARSMVK